MLPHTERMLALLRQGKRRRPNASTMPTSRPSSMPPDRGKSSTSRT